MDINNINEQGQKAASHEEEMRPIFEQFIVELGLTDMMNEELAFTDNLEGFDRLAGIIAQLTLAR